MTLTPTKDQQIDSNQRNELLPGHPALFNDRLWHSGHESCKKYQPHLFGPTYILENQTLQPVFTNISPLYSESGEKSLGSNREELFRDIWYISRLCRTLNHIKSLHQTLKSFWYLLIRRRFIVFWIYRFHASGREKKNRTHTRIYCIYIHDVETYIKIYGCSYGCSYGVHKHFGPWPSLTILDPEMFRSSGGPVNSKESESLTGVGVALFTGRKWVSTFNWNE